MPKSRPATWLEKEMMLNLIKKSGKKLDVDLDKCDYIRSSAGNLVCMFEDQPVFYVTKGCRLAMPPRPKKIKTSLRNKNLKKLAKKDAKKKAAHEKQVEKQREKMAQIAEQGKEEIDRSIFETVQDREKRMRWVKVIDEEAEKVNCGEMKFDIFPVFEDSLGSVRMRIVVQPKMDKKIGEIMPKQIPPQNWSDDMVRERIERVTQSDAFEIRLNKDVEYNLRASVLNYIKNNQASFNKGDGAGDLMQEIDFLTEDKMEYDEFLRAFSVTEEVMKINEDEFDYMSYVYGLTGLPDSTGQKTIDKQVLLIEPLEYKEDKVIKDFVIAIDTSGSCSGELVKRFLNKTYSILKETESFSSRVNIHIVQCDARIQNDTKITNMEEMEDFMKNMKLYGFGGTDFRPVFEYVDTLIKNKEFDNLCGLIYFTDGYGTYPTMPTPYKTAFAFLEDYDHKAVPPWAMSVYWKDDELVTSED